METPAEVIEWPDFELIEDVPWSSAIPIPDLDDKVFIIRGEVNAELVYNYVWASL